MKSSNENMILLYSSDRYSFYQKDILAITSLPKGYCFHFRYPEEYVSPAIQKGYRSLEGAPALIFYVAGNKDKENTKIELIPIRLSTIKHIQYKPDTNLYHVYFTLQEFIELKEDPNLFEDTPHNNIFLGQRIIQPNYNVVEWGKTVELLYKFIPSLYFNVALKTEAAENDVIPGITSKTYMPYFQLKEGKNYLLEISIADFNSNKDVSQIRTEIYGTDIKSNISRKISSGLKWDDRKYEVSGLLLGDLSSTVNLLKAEAFDLGINEPFYEIELPFKVQKDCTRLWSYFKASIFLFLGGGLLAFDSTKQSLTGWEIFFKGLGLILTSAATAWLYYRFNKK